VVAVCIKLLLWFYSTPFPNTKYIYLLQSFRNKVYAKLLPLLGLKLQLANSYANHYTTGGDN